MKQYIFNSLSLLIMSIMLFACDNDDKDYSGSDYYFYSTIGNLEKSENSDYYIDSDKGKRLLIGNPEILQTNDIKEGDRVYGEFLLYNEKPTNYDEKCSMYFLRKVLVKDPLHLTDANKEEIADDNINVSDIWISKNYINFRFQFLTDGTAKIAHYINLVTVDNQPEGQDEGYLYLEFRHNAYNDSPLYLYSGIVSFNTDELMKQNESLKGFYIRVNTYSHGEKVYKLNLADNVNETPKIDTKSMSEHTDMIR